MGPDSKISAGGGRLLETSGISEGKKRKSMEKTPLGGSPLCQGGWDERREGFLPQTIPESSSKRGTMPKAWG